MIKYIHNEITYDSLQEVKQLMPNVSFPQETSADDLLSVGVTPIEVEDVVVEEEEPIEYVPTTEDIINGYTQTVQSYLDTTAQERGYDNILSLCTYVNSDVDKFKIEGKAGVNFRDSVWAKCYKILAEVQAGTRDIPTDIIAELPVMEWGETL